MHTDRLNISTLCSLAVIAFVAACAAHEAVGHGIACLSTGGTVTLLTSVYFHCRPSVPFVDAAGTLMNLVVAATLVLALHRTNQPSQRSVFLGLILAFSGFWGAGYFIFSALTNVGDLAFVLRDLSLEPRWLWRLGMGILGVWLYVKILRKASGLVPKGMPLFVAYCVVGVVACASVLFYQGPTLPALKDAAQESLLAPSGLLFIAFSRPSSQPIFVPASRSIIMAAAVTIAIFWFTLGKGISGG
jgi:hypothetical protein